jgi:hypothetical protein
MRVAARSSCVVFLSDLLSPRREPKQESEFDQCSTEHISLEFLAFGRDCSHPKPMID